MRSKTGAGIAAGLLAGLVYGIVMQIVTMPAPMPAGGTPMSGAGGMPMSGESRVPMMAMVAQVVRSDSLVVGWIFLLIMGMAMGAVFAWAFGDRAVRIGGGLAWGLLYGILWWALGTLVLMPILLGMPVFGPLTMASMRPGAMWSLASYLLSGPILGVAFACLHGGQAGPQKPNPQP